MSLFRFSDAQSMMLSLGGMVASSAATLLLTGEAKGSSAIET